MLGRYVADHDPLIRTNGSASAQTTSTTLKSGNTITRPLLAYLAASVVVAVVAVGVRP